MPAFSSERLAETFVEVADTLVADFDVVDFLTVVVERAAELSGAAAAGLLLADDQGRLRFVAATTESARVVDLFQVEQDQGPGQDCYRQGRPVSHADLGRAGDQWPLFAPRAVAAGFASVHAFPLRHGSAVIGALDLFGSTAGIVAADTPRIVQALADVATIGLLQHQTIARSEVLTAQLQQALDSRVTIEQAKGALTQLRGVDPDAAFGMLRTYSRNNHHRLTDVASAVLKDPASHPGADVPLLRSGRRGGARHPQARAGRQRATARPSQAARSSISGSTALRSAAEKGAVLVHRVDPQHSRRQVGGGVDLPDQAVTVQDRQRPVAPPPLGHRLVHLELVVELEQLGHPLAVEHQPVQRRQQDGASAERHAQPVELCGVDPPLSAHARRRRRPRRPGRRRSARRAPRPPSRGRCPARPGGGGPARPAPRRRARRCRASSG